jgi:drug/metabolite transporter (DMT)-like permease
VNALNPARGTALLLLASVFSASSGPLAKPAMQAGLSPQQVAAGRIGLAAVILVVGVAVTKPRLLRVHWQDWRLLLGYGLFAVAGVQVLYFASVSRLPVGIAMLLEFMSPVLVALWVRFVRGTILPRRAWLGTGLALLGLAMVAQVWQGLQLDAIGLLAGIGAALCAAGYFLIGEHGVRTHHPLTLTTWGMLIGSVFVLALAPPWTFPASTLIEPTQFGPVWMVLVEIALFSTVFAYAFGVTALRHLPSNVASVLSLAEPVVATVAAWALLDEQLTVVQIMGGSTLLLGAFLVQRASQSPAGEQIHRTVDDSSPSHGQNLVH